MGKRNCKVDYINKNLIITYGKPHKNVSAESIWRWVKEELTHAAIDTNIYKPHSCREPSSSKAKSEFQDQKKWNKVASQQIVLLKIFYDKNIINKQKYRWFGMQIWLFINRFRDSKKMIICQQCSCFDLIKWLKIIRI